MPNFDILFRGIPKNQEQFTRFKKIWPEHCNHTFVFGSVVFDNHSKKWFIVVTASADTLAPTVVHNGTTSMIEVIPETIGQYTNFDAKSKTESDYPVFTNDVVYIRTRYGMDYATVVLKDGKFCTEWNSEAHFPDKAKLHLHYELNSQIKVMGNLYEDKDLLE